MRKLIALFFIFSPISTYAGVNIGATRVIYSEGEKQASVSINNPDENPYLIQAWVNKTQASNHQDNIPFIIAPPLFRLDSHSQNSVRIIYTGKPLPSDRESMFWLSIKAIPASPRGANYQIVVSSKSIFKLFYRPKGLAGYDGKAYQKLEFRRQNGKIIVKNPTPYYLSFAKVTIGKVEVTDLLTLAPFASQTLNLPANKSHVVSVQVINDFGGISDPFNITF